MNFRYSAFLAVLIISVSTVLALAMVVMDQAESWEMAVTQVRRLAHNPLMQWVYGGWCLCCGVLAFILGRYRKTHRGLVVTPTCHPDTCR